MCQGEAFLSSAGLSTGALIAILLCIVILLGKLGQLLWVLQHGGKLPGANILRVWKEEMNHRGGGKGGRV